MVGKSAFGTGRAALRRHVCCTNSLAWVKFQSVVGSYLGSQGFAARATNPGDPIRGGAGVAAQPASERINAHPTVMRLFIVMIPSPSLVDLIPLIMRPDTTKAMSPWTGI